MDTPTLKFPKNKRPPHKMFRKFISLNKTQGRKFVSALVQGQRMIEMGTAGKKRIRQVLLAEHGRKDSPRQWKRLVREDKRVTEKTQKIMGLRAKIRNVRETKSGRK